NRDCERQGRYS
ncbi:MSHA biogenesis MshI domain protein, partial [Vibrio parahaemolyticus V-223/04]